MATGRPPFSGATATETIDRIIHAQPEAIVRINHNVPADLERIIRKCLEKDRERRYRCAAELLADLKSLKQELSSASMPAISVAQVLRKPQAVILAGLIVLALALATTWFFHRAAKARWAQREGLSELARLMQKEDYVAAFRVARQVERYVPDDPLLTKLRRDFLLPVSIHTSPPDADVYMKEYKDAQGNWEYLGHSPIEGIKLPFGYFRWRIAKKGFAMVDAATHGAYNPITFTLDPEGSLPPGMVRVPGGNFQLGSSPPVQLDDFLIDTYEVTNREFKKFVDAEGYRKREYWKEEFLRDGRRLTWEQAMAAFRDVTGRPGPSTWELGDYPRGQEEFPVSGVSWYEAAAYAEFAGKSLPTVYHWYKAAGAGIFSDILQFSNFRGKGPARVGSHQGIGPYGTYDMAGNVKEWCWNATGDHRYILGGGWNEPVYMFTDEDARSAFDRSATHGFRCMKYLGAGPISQALTGRIKRIARDYSKEKPVSDDIFRVYQSLYSYDRGALNPVIESVDMSSEYWTKQRITFNAAYGNDRIIAHLFTPKNVAPPYQTVVYFPHGGALQQRSFENMDVILLDFIIRSGRALFCPIYKGTYERQVNDRLGPNAERDLVIQWSKDLGRSLDYLESRADIDGKKLAFYGVSLGAQIGPVLLSLEKRLNVAVLWFGGLPLNRRLPEIDPINFAPRVRIPVLMLNGQYDFTFPVRTSQIPLFRLLGTPELDKRHVLYEGGHVLPRNQLIKETLDWLDRYLGPVK